MNSLHVLSSDINYRREWFGGIVYSSISKETRFFNHAAAFAIEQFSKPISIAFARKAIQPLLKKSEELDPFFLSLKKDKIIAPQANNDSIGRFFFTNHTDFKDSRFYSPLGVELELTLKCMRKCLYCAYDSSPDVSTAKQLTREDYSILFQQLREAGVFYLRFTGGDPLTRSDSLDIISDADQFQFAVALASDLTVLRTEQAKRLGSFKNLTALQTTLDGHTAEIADKLRGPGNFHRVTRGISLLRENNVPVIVGTVLTKLNLNNIYEIAKYLSKWNVAYCVSPLYDAGRGRSLRNLIPSDDELTHAYEQFAAAVNDGLVRAADPGWSAIAEATTANIRHALWSGQPWLIRSPDRLLRVNPFGHCYTSIHLKEVIGNEIYVGKLPGNDILKIWNSAPLLNKLRAVRQKSRYYGDVIDIRQVNKNMEELL